MIQPLSEAERIFYTEIREKKRTASGVHHKTGKNGYVGTMRFPTDIMTRKEKYNHRKAGKVMTTNLYDEILTLEEFEKLETFEKKNRLQYWRLHYSNKEIIKKMGMYNASFYKMVNELELPKAKTIRKGKSNSEPKMKEAATPAPVPEKGPEKVPEPVQELIVNGLHLVFKGTFSPETIQNQLLKFTTLLDGEQDDFFVEVRLMQKEKQSV